MPMKQKKVLTTKSTNNKIPLAPTAENTLCTGENPPKLKI